MEIKKTPKANLENKKTMAILIGLVLALGIMFIAFEWSKNEIKVYEDAIQGEFVEDENYNFNSDAHFAANVFSGKTTSK